jgi:hypothetical protein
LSGLVGPPSGALRRAMERTELRTTVQHMIAVAAVCTAGFVLAIGVRAPRTDLAVRTYSAALAGCILAVAIRALVVRAHSAPAPGYEELVAGEDEGRSGAPAGLVHLELAVRFGASAAGDFHVRLRPVLADLARERLRAHGVRLDQPRHRERAEALLGPAVYELVRPGVAPPEQRFAPGPSRALVEAATAALERL